jgi:hypothetical protein
VETRIPASERTSQKLTELLTTGVADGDARAELLKLAVRKIVEEALEAEVTEALGRGYYENGAERAAGIGMGIAAGDCARPRAPSSTGSLKSPIGPSRSCRASAGAWPAGPPSSSSSRWRCTRGG